MRFTDRVCIVTGAASGIGRATATAFAAEGAKVAAIDCDVPNGEGTARSISQSGGVAVFIRADVAVAQDVRAAIDAIVARWKRIDVLVNNAGIMTFDPAVDLAEEDWDRVIAVNLRSVFLFCKYALAHIKGGAIVNVSSVHARQTSPGVSSYAASKGAIEAFTRALSRENSPECVRVNCVAPGGVDTPLLWSNPAIKKMRRQDVILSKPEEIASVILFLASDDSSTINGSTVVADRGLLTTL